MKKILVAMANGVLSLAILSSGAVADPKNSAPIPSPHEVAEHVVGKWRYGIFRVEYTPIESSGRGRVSAAGTNGTYLPTRCGPGENGNMVIRTEDEEVCVIVQFVGGIQVIKFPPQGSSAAREVQLYPVQ